MKRYDLRNLKNSFYDRLLEIVKNSVNDNENAIFIFEIGDFSPIEEVANIVKQNNWTLINSLKYNESDWMVAIKKEEDKNKIEKEEKKGEEI